MAAKVPCILLLGQIIGPKPKSTLKQDRPWAEFAVRPLLYNRLMHSAHVFFVFLSCYLIPSLQHDRP